MRLLQLFPFIEAVEAVEAPEDVLGGHAVVAGAEPEGHAEYVNCQPDKPVFTINENHQYLRDECRYGSKGIEVRLRIIGEGR